MSRRRPAIFYLSFGASLLAAAAAAWVLGSSWALWSLLPQGGSVRLVASGAVPQRSEIFSLISRYNLPGELIAAIDASPQAGISSASSGPVVIISPRIKDQYRTQRLLNQSGWIVARRGLLLLAWPEQSSPSWPSSRLGYASSFFKNMWRTRTLVPAAVLNVRGGVTALATARQTSFRIYVSDTLTDIRKYNPRSASLQDTYDLYVSIPGHVLSVIPPEIKGRWNKDLAEALGLKHNPPDLLGYLSQYEDIVIVQRGEHTAVGVSGATDTYSAAVISWLESENSYNHPVKKGFRLPDGTLGYEWVPGAKEEVFGEWRDGCRAPAAGKSSAWLCLKPLASGQDRPGEQGSFAVLASSEELARSTAVLSGAWGIRMAPAWLNRHVAAEMCQNGASPLIKQLCRLQAISASGYGHGAVIEIGVK